jgi:hypothetical protein
VPHHACGTWFAACYAAADVHTPHGIAGQAVISRSREGLELREGVASQISLHGLAAPHTTLTGRRPATVAQPPPPSCRNAARPSRSRLFVAADDKAWEPSDRAKAAIASAGEVRFQSSATAGATGNRPLMMSKSGGGHARAEGGGGGAQGR